ncbi:hypothetical protein VaNZ11_012393 [Volvox africanus]|uniref:BRCT domain-containing protein n=1 Tax=Volvox africanus TaxID=51714 RepID=A0ABQ5SDV7_9CHLO|nr:hypothetical protein VaNZ11_012393 [Volvox africanus]
MAKPQGILEGCCVHLWKRVDGDGLSLEGITAKVKELGGKVATKLTKEVTHIIFQRALGSSVKELLAEDEDLRFIYRKIERSSGRLVVVSPLWLRSCETVKARAKEARFIVPQPKKPIFLDHIERGENKRKRRKSYSARPREQVEVPDFENALFSSSQQIRDLSSFPDCQINDGRTNREDDKAMEQSAIEGEMQPPRLRTAGPPNVPTGPIKASSGLRGVPVRLQQSSSSKRGMRQLSLNFFVLPKKPRLSLAKVTEPYSAMQRPTAELEVQETCAEDKSTAAEVLPKARPEFMLGGGPSPAAPGAVADHGDGELRGQQPEWLGKRSLGGESSAAMVTIAVCEHVTKPGTPTLASLANTPLASAAPPRVQMLQVTDRGKSCAAAAAAVAAVALEPVAGAPEFDKVGEKPAAAAAATLPPGGTEARRSSTRDAPRLLAGTPLALGLIKSLGRLTPLTTPNGITPGGLVVPKLKLQGNVATLAATSGLPSGPDIPSVVKPIVESPPGLARCNRGSARTLAKLGADGLPASIPAAGHEPVRGLESETSAADTHSGAPPIVPVSTHRHAKIRGLLPPTPPVPVQMGPERARDCSKAAAAGAVELVKTESVSDPGIFGSFLGPNGSQTPVLCNAVVPATFSKAMLGGSGDGREKEAESAGGHDLDGTVEEEHGGGGVAGTAVCRRSQRRTRATALKSLHQSPVLYGGTSRQTLKGEAETASARIPAAEQGQPHEAGEPAGLVTHAEQEVAPSTLAPPCPGLTPSFKLRRSARLVSLSPSIEVLPDRDLVNEHDAVPVTDWSSRPTGSRSQRRHRQELHDFTWGGFQPPHQHPNLNPGPPPSVRKLCREVVSLLQEAPCTAAPWPEDRAPAANCTPATARKTRRRKQVADEEEPSTRSQQEVDLNPGSLQEGPRHHDAPMLLAPYDLAVAAPSPAFCTRSRTRTAAVTPRLVPAEAAEQPRKVLGVPSPPHQADGKWPEGRSEPCNNGVRRPLPQTQPEILHSVPGGNPSYGVRTAGASGLSLPVGDAAPSVLKRQGTAARSRRGALNSGLACAAQAPPGTALKVGSTGLTDLATALEAAAESPICAVVQATYAAGGDLRLEEPQLPPVGRAEGPALAPVLSLPPYSGSTVCENTPTDLSHAAAVVAGPIPALLRDAAARTNSETTGVTESHGPSGPHPMRAEPKGASPAAGGYLCVSSSIGVRSPPLPPRPSMQKPQSEVPADELYAPGKGSEDSDWTREPRIETRQGQITQCIGASSMDGSVDGAHTDRGSMGATGLITSAMPKNVTATMMIDTLAAAAKPTSVACNFLVSISRSRLRLRKQEAADQEPMAHLGGEAHGGSGGPQAATASTAAALPTSKQPAAMLRRNLSTLREAPALEAAAGVFELGGGDRPESVLLSSVEATAVLSGPSQHTTAREARDTEEGKVAATKACRAAAKKWKLLSVSGQPSATAVVNLQGVTSRSMVLPNAITGATAMACRPASTCLGEVGNSKLNRTTPAAVPDVVPSSRTKNPEAPAAWLAPALGQYPRGKDHPMRAGYRYLACTKVGEEMEATIEKAVRKLGGARQCTPGYEDGHITHLVAGDASTRTLKVLLGIANGAMFVAPSWVEASLAAGEWVPEEQHLLQGTFAEAANAVRASMQAQQQRGVGARGAPAAEGAAAAVVSVSQPAEPFAGIVAKPLTGRMVAVQNSQCNGPRLADMQKKKAKLETIVKALGGRLGPLRSADLVIMIRGSTLPQTSRRSVKVASEEWLVRLAETHIWQEP